MYLIVCMAVGFVDILLILKVNSRISLLNLVNYRILFIRNLVNYRIGRI